MEYIKVNKIEKQGNIFTGEQWLEFRDLEVIDGKGNFKRKARITDALIKHIQTTGLVIAVNPSEDLKSRILKEHPDIKKWFEKLQLSLC